MMNRPVYIVNAFGEVDTLNHVDRETENALKRVGNWFETEVEAGKARVRVLEALKKKEA